MFADKDENPYSYPVYSRSFRLFLGSLSNDDGDGKDNGNGKIFKSIRSILAEQQLWHTSRFFVHFFYISLHDLNVKVPIISRFVKHGNTRRFFFFSSTLKQSFRIIQRQKKLPTFDELNEME